MSYLTRINPKNRCVIFVFVLLFGSAIIFKCRMLAHINFYLDQLEAQLAPVRPHLPANSTIGFEDDNHSAINDYDAFKYVLAPIKFIDERRDTMIYVQQHAGNQGLPHYRVAWQSKSRLSTISLLIKEK
jgi:hypothetical protein